MRLTDKEKAACRSSVLKLDPNAEIFLYGSRTQDHLKGGDIDLLVLSNQLTFKDKLTILIEIKLSIGDQKIDLTLKPKASLANDPFVQSIFTGAVKL